MNKKIAFTVYLDPDSYKEFSEIMDSYPSIRPVNFRAMSMLIGANSIATMFEDVGLANRHLMSGLLAAMQMARKLGMSKVQGEEE